MKPEPALTGALHSMENDENRPGLNTGEPWSEMDLIDLGNSVRLHDSVEEIARFLCRSRRDVRNKIAELGQRGELENLITKAAARVARRF